MNLSALVQDLEHARIIGDADVTVAKVRDDSRQVEPGDVFVAVRGLRTDGHQHVELALSRGAAAIVVEREQPGAGAAQVVVPSTADALGPLAARAAGCPADRLVLVGITGTNGKTTTTFLVESVLRAARARTGVIGTVNYRYGDAVVPAPYTTPTPLVLHQVLADIAGAGCTHAVLEVSSAALAMNRLAGVRFQVGAFTNLSQDHLDVHGTMDAYRQSKELLFARCLADSGVAVINLDDPAAPSMIAAAGAHRLLRVSSRADADAEVRIVRGESSIAGVRADVATPRGTLEVASRELLGAYNMANMAMAVAVGEALGLAHEDVARGIADMPGVPGRVERVANDRGLDILVDYAHTPDALENVLSALRPLARRRLLCVFGCGGDRDPDKRPKMGAAVAAIADLAVVTSDNPRTEDPRSIIDMILPGVPAPFFVDVDRRVAIQAAVAEATPDDVVLIAGKGHEDYQILGTQKVHFDDREEAARAASLRQDFSLADVLAACGGALAHRPAGRDDASARFSRVIIDGRGAATGDLYVAIRGERFDGHAFCAQAVAAGAAGVIIERGAALPRTSDGAIIDAHVIEVAPGTERGEPGLDGGRVALAAIARWHRRRFRDRPVIGVTGSVGKTTTKELLAAALRPLGRVHATQGSFNNETGVPLTLLGLRPYHDACVIEMGMRGLGQIDYLARVAEPTVGVIVNAGTAHVGVVGSADDIARGKSEIFAHLGARGVAILPAGDARLLPYAEGAGRRLTFGREPGADVRLVRVQSAGAAGLDIVIAAGGDEHAVRLPLPGEHNAINAACAVAAAMAAGVPAAHAVASLAHARPAPMRGEIIEAAGRHVLLDCYNANPASMRAALTTLRTLGGTARALAVLGDMLELGDAAPGAHRDAGRQAAALDIDVIALGEHARDVLEGAPRGAVAGDAREAAAAALERTRPGDWILIKASRGMRLERVVDELRALAQGDALTRETEA